jgi:D-3-phosphoglycerate dehydrogenase
MKTGAMLVNTSRGQIVDETALTDALIQKHLGGAALDVFENEPYEGKLSELDNVILTAHIGASANESRYKMELGAAEDCLRVLSNKKPFIPAY